MVLPKYAAKVAAVKGIPEADKILKDFVGGMDKITAKHLREGGPIIVDAAKARTPIDTGRLVSSTKVLKVTDKALWVGSTAPYARHVHDGTSRMPARPYFAQPIMDFKQKFPQLVVKDCTQFYQELVRKNPPR